MYTHPYQSRAYGYPPTQGGYTTTAVGQPVSPISGGPAGAPAGAPFGAPGQMPLEQSYIENILRLNLGKMATLYMTYENNTQWNAKIFKGRLEAAGRDHIIISDPTTGMRFLLLMVNLDYITFDEELKYSYPYAMPTR
ncbi:spore coat protein GerQ [Paenibacillus filicis]|uniref:Spore coat protein GerQ n=1 Tax=Paenibacillus gyeongsangnamensis TaxID=3388067 RepID=A0ABT4QKY3_9BACL|nr:spore coat protein GerQ [Paenibacillus filicis]MCZ8517518.1 spore coat protein GerQ [Paenibacillus filicis]